MLTRCPGTNSILEPLPEPVTCPHCGKEVEMFTNEARLKCYHCGEMIVRAKRLSCFDWCRYADRCAMELGIDLTRA